MGSVESQSPSFGAWLKAQRRRHRLTQAELARQVSCAPVTIRKIEANQRRPSSQLTELLADYFAVAPQSRSAFLSFAREGIVPTQALIVGMGVQSRNVANTAPHLLLQGPRTERKPLLVQSAAAYLVDARADSLLLDLQGQQMLPVASTTKILTALIAIEQGDLQQRVLITHDMLEKVKRYNGHCASLIADDQIALIDLLYAMMLSSGDDAALAVAEAVAGNMTEFVKLMNHYARCLHLSNTRYVNPSGTPYLTAEEHDIPENYSSAADLVHLAHYAMENRLFTQIVQLQQYELPATSSHHAYTWQTTNRLLGSYAGMTGIKTGFTPSSGSCFVFSATSNTQHLIGAVLQSTSLRQRYIDAEELLDWGFARRDEKKL